MSRAVRGPEDSKAATFPRTVRHVSDCAFAGPALKSVVLNEGLETLGECQQKYVGVFNCARLKQVALQSTLRVLGDYAFYCCAQLRRVELREGSRLEEIGNSCFSYSGLEEFVALRGLRKIGRSAFRGCARLKRAVLNEGVAVLGDENNCGVFQDSGFEEITLPGMPKELGRSTFS